ncbi:glycosyltransferase family 32 protein [Roseibacillus ishigakijimensis]|uniref:Glycosyltransferase sugar-binding region containing DXD motif-containing protein n=1 Tax=Roseibacillus ishigakijimensis TaxID=454146 RepID=A0A934RUD3_9BACT|nr:glycosyltransferase [Roseibacillus ishigakijimensis]MBK1835588.1 hypothetical protein [Roseibacillus ishigakijimensis]
MIPKRLICTHKSEYALEPKLRFCLERMKELHPTWEWCFFSDEDCEAFVAEEMPQYAELYRWYPRPVLKADCFRLLAVMRLGGFYLDTDFLVEAPLDPLCEHEVVFPWEWTLGWDDFEMRFPPWLGLKAERRAVGNYAFGAEAGHPFLQALLDEMVVRTENFEAENCVDLDVLHATGPDLVTSVYYERREEWSTVHLLGSRTMGLGALWGTPHQWQLAAVG